MTPPPPRAAGPRRPDDGLGAPARQLLQTALQRHGAGQLDGAAKLYGEILAAHPEHPPTLNFLALVHHQGGQPAAALGFVERALAADPGDPSFHLCRAHVLSGLGRQADAIASCRHSLTLAPDNPDALNQLGLLLVAGGQLAEARAPLERACQLQPANPAPRANLGEVLRQLGALDAALAACRAAVQLAPQLAEAHLLLGNVLKDLGELTAARASFEQAARLKPNLASAHHNLGIARRADGDLAGALGAFRAALDLEPQSVAHQTAVGACLVALAAGPFDARCRDDLMAALRDAWARPEDLAPTAINLLTAEPAVAAAIAWAETAVDAPVVAPPRDGALGAVLRDPPLGALLEASGVPDPALERLLTRLRAALLGAATAPPSGGWPEAEPRFAAALAIQCFDNDYAWAVSTAEQVRLDALIAAVEAAPAAGTPPDELAMLALASYRPLHQLAAADRLLAAAWRAPARAVVQQQIAQPRAEIGLRRDIRVLGTIEDAVSRAVRAQYEDNPYPRWTRMPRIGAPMPLHVGLIAEYPRLRDSLAEFPARPRILVAGCGTGWEPIAVALSYQGASVLAVDISLTSLAYAARKTRELAIATIDYRHADILDLAGLGERFDLIETSGVLHHMADPLQGWRILCGLLKADGVMRVSLYSEIGRQSVIAARALIAQRGYRPDPEGIRRARADILGAAPGSPLAALTRSADLYSLSGCRDLLFHVQEHRFTLPQIADALDALGLELLGFTHPNPAIAARYKTTYPNDPEMTDLACWAAFEQAHPETFGGMYNMCLRRQRGGVARP